MNEKEILLTAIGQDFGLKPTKPELTKNLVTNYGVNKTTAQRLIVDCLHSGLIKIDNLAYRISITQKGLDWLKNQDEFLPDIDSNSSQSKIDSKTEELTWWYKNKWWVIPGLITLLIFILSIIAHMHGLL